MNEIQRSAALTAAKNWADALVVDVRKLCDDGFPLLLPGEVEDTSTDRRAGLNPISYFLNAITAYVQSVPDQIPDSAPARLDAAHVDAVCQLLISQMDHCVDKAERQQILRESIKFAEAVRLAVLAGAKTDFSKG